MLETNKKILTTVEARKILGISKSLMYDLLATDETFPAFRIGNKWCINADKLNEWIDEQSNRR